MRWMVVFIAAMSLAGCASTSEEKVSVSEPVARVRATLKGIGERGGLVFADDPWGDGATTLTYLDQGWNPAESLWFYHADQGSTLMDYEVFTHLEQADSEKLFRAPEHMTRFRFLAQHRTPNNPDALPVGFTRHDDQVGLTCATCHTGQIVYHGAAVRIDGAPSIADVTGFFRVLAAALSATLADPAKLARFSAKVPDGEKRLRKALDFLDSYNTANRSSTVEGYARMDAIGRIINEVIRFTSDPKNSLEPNAPASLPLLWDAPRHDYVQWTAFAPNAGAGSLGRNAGEVTGVFGRIEVKHYESEEAAKKGYPSTVEANALVDMEESLRGLMSRLWPEKVLPPIDRALASRGAALYQANCVSCHALIVRDDPRRKVTAMVTGVDVVCTDDTSASNLVNARAPTGILQGAISPKGDRYGAEASALALVADLATRTVSAQPLAALRAVANAKLHGLETTTKQGNHAQDTTQNPTADLMSYKARPLNGTWASSPYLHNGSVPTLYDLLLPPAQRPAKFAVGRWSYDPRKVGYVSDGEAPFLLDTTLHGNSNRGHQYGVNLSDEERWALVEYLKTL